MAEMRKGRRTSKKLRRRKEGRNRFGTRRISDRDRRWDSSRPHLLTAGTHAGVTTFTYTEEAQRPDGNRRTHPSRRSFGTARRIGAYRPEATWAQPLGPGRAVLTRGVSRRSGSVACIRADASPTEVLALTMLALRTLIVKPIDDLVTQSSDARLTTTVGTAGSRGPNCGAPCQAYPRDHAHNPARSESGNDARADVHGVENPDAEAARKAR